MTAPMPRPTIAELLAFEAANPSRHPSKDEPIRRELGITPARYYQLLHRAIDTEEAARIDPVTTHTARRVRDTTRARHMARLFP